MLRTAVENGKGYLDTMTLVTVISQNRVQRMQERFALKTDGKGRVLADETKAVITSKIQEIEKLTEEDFDGLDNDEESASHSS